MMRCALDIHCYRRQPNPELTAWLDVVRKTCPVRMVYSQYDICLARRQSLANFIHKDMPAGYTHLVQIDEDMVPVGGTDNILTAPGDLVYCGYRGKRGRRGHYGDGDFGCGCSRISAYLASLLNVATSFDFELDAARTAVVACECDVFRRQAEGLGFASMMVGVVGHLVEMIAVPVFGGGDEIQLRWPAGA
jgi:hypothetical protein